LRHTHTHDESVTQRDSDAKSVADVDCCVDTVTVTDVLAGRVAE
jgi:hypothetical protein